VLTKHNTNYDLEMLGSFNFFLRDALAKAVDAGEFTVHKKTYKLNSSKPSMKKRKRETTSSPSPKKKRSASSSPSSSTSSTSKTKTKTTKSSSRSSSKGKKEASSSSTTTTSTPTKKIRISKASVSFSPDTLSTSSTTEEGTAKVSRPIGIKGDYLWQYLDGVWKNYDALASNTVEDVYLKYLENRGDTDVRAVKSGSWEYQVDFMAMKQTNIQHANHTTRNIRRVKITSSG